MEGIEKDRKTEWKEGKQKREVGQLTNETKDRAGED